MHACGQEANLEAIIAATKSKRYTRTRIDRMVMCAFLGITKEILEAEVPYIRILAFNDRGREVLKQAKKDIWFVNTGEAVDHPHWELEQRCGSLYGLCSLQEPENPEEESKQRVYYKKTEG